MAVRRSGRSIAAIAAGTVLAVLGGAAIVSAWTAATADIVSADLDEAIRTAPETIPDFSAVPVETARAEVVAERTLTPPAPIEYAQFSAAAIDRAAQPAFRQAEAAIRDYEPRFQFAGDRPPHGGTRSEVTLALGEQIRARRAPPSTPNALAGIRSRLEPSREVERNGRWLLFASDDQQSLGLNLLRGRSGEMARMSWTTDNVASVGDMQAGIGWRKGAFQASLAFVDREISIYGKSRDEQFMAFTISIKPRGANTSQRRDRMQPEAYAPRSVRR